MQRAKSRPARGELVTLTEGHYSAGVSVVGATLDWLKFKGRDLVMKQLEDGSDYRGAVGVPWANSLVDGAYNFQGKQHQLPLVDEEAEHGLLRYTEFKVREKSAQSVELFHHLWPQPGYPFSLEITVVYALNSDTGLETSVTSRNCGQRTAPYGACGHPYVIAGPEPMAEWTVTVPHTWVQRHTWQFPEEIEMAHESSLDMRAGQKIGDLEIDDAFGGLKLDSEGRWRVTVTAPGGTGVEVSANYCCPWVALCDGGTHDPPGLAIDPSTSPPHAFRSKTDLITLKPGESHTVNWRIRQLGDFTPSGKADERRPSEPAAPNFPTDAQRDSSQEPTAEWIVTVPLTFV